MPADEADEALLVALLVVLLLSFSLISHLSCSPALSSPTSPALSLASPTSLALYLSHIPPSHSCLRLQVVQEALVLASSSEAFQAVLVVPALVESPCSLYNLCVLFVRGFCVIH